MIEPSDAHVDAALEVAFREARLAARFDEVPVGAALLGPDGALIAADHNRCETLHDPSAHAELLVVRTACAAAGGTRLPEGCLLAVTLEPCAMCAGALVWARLRWLVFAAPDIKAGACGSLRNVVADRRLNHRVGVLPSRRTAESAALLRTFFAARRGPRRGQGPGPREGA